jgi:soluble lytic murein transglycosylase-like protein
MRFCLYMTFGLSILGAAEPAGVVPVVRADPRSGQLIKTIVVKPRVIESRIVAPQTAPASVQMPVKDLIEQTAMSYEVSPELVESVIQVESNFNPFAVSPKGAEGLMQLMPGTARRFGVRNTFDAKQNIEGGVRYLKFLQDTFKDDRLAIAAYNAGEGAVQKYGNVPPYPETMDYVAKVGEKYGQARRAEQARKKAVQKKTDETPNEPQYRKLAQYVDADGKVYLMTQ